MKILEKGHIYKLENKRVEIVAEGKPLNPDNLLTFVNQQLGQEHGGCTTQEVIRALIDRTRHCANCMPHPVNERIIYHLRMALGLHEARAIERRIEKENFAIEYVPTEGGSHLQFPHPKIPEGPVTRELLPHPMDGAKTINHPNV